ncbi:MAG: family 43 glycosylhydrolase [Gemmatimonadota bacterium]
MTRSRTLTAARALRALLSVSAALVAVAPLAHAQDSRAVKEPVAPTACTVLAAGLVPVGDSTVSAADESRVDSPRIQAALDGCAAGQAVVLRAAGQRRAFVSGPLRLKAGVTLVLDTGVIVFASRDPRLFDIAPGACGVLSEGPRGCRPVITAERANGSGVMGPGTLDGRGWATLLNGDVTWWEMAEQARDTKYSQNNPRLILATRSNDFTLYRLRLRNSPNFHVVYERGDGFTAWGVTINTPRGARNTDGIDPSGATNVSILHSYIHTGDDNVAIKAGTNGGARNITVAHSHFYNGHGVSVGSETDGGASGILVHDVTFDGTDNALRVKSNGSRGGLVDGVTYDNVCIRNVKAPVFMDSHYTASPELDGAKIPHFRNIVVRNVRIIGAGTITLDGYDAARPLGITFDRLIADEPARIKVVGRHAELTLAAGGSSIEVPATVARVQGPRVRPTPTPALAACEGRLVPFPGGAAKAITVRKLPKPAPPADQYTNPILSADFSDPDVIRDGDDFWMTASSFGHVPGLPILHSRDLVHWSIVNHAIARFDSATFAGAFDAPQHGNGVWAPSIRKHDGWFWIYYGDPDRGIFMTRTRDPRVAWSPPVLVAAGKGLIDPSPLWDEDGRAYLVHAYARSRSGIKHRLVVRGMRPDGTALLDSGTVVFEDSVHHPTAEGPKFYKRDGWYWILAPAGGVATGWQLALRSKAPRGPYAVRTVLAQGSTTVNGPHQGAWVSSSGGDDWFLHFQDRGAFGRIVHLQPLTWRSDGWPVIGAAAGADTTGTPVETFRMPSSAATSTPGAMPTAALLQTTDEFDSGVPGLQWQWQANPRPSWLGPVKPGVLRLVAQPLAAPARSLWDAPNLLMQKFPAAAFSVTTSLSANGTRTGDRAGLIVFGLDYAWVGVRRAAAGWELVAAALKDADKGGTESVTTIAALAAPEVVLRVSVDESGVSRFAWSTRDGALQEIPASIFAPFTAREGKWVGAKVGVFASAANPSTPSPSATTAPLVAQVNYVRVKTP